MATLRRCEVQKFGKEPEWWQSGDATIKPSYLVMKDDSDEVTICTASAKPVGVAGSMTFHDLNTAYDSGIKIPVWRKGCGITIYVLHDDDTGAATLDSGIPLVADDANSGCVMIWTTETAPYIIGYNRYEVTISGDTPTFIQCMMTV